MLDLCAGRVNAFSQMSQDCVVLYLRNVAEWGKFTQYKYFDRIIIHNVDYTMNIRNIL